MNLDAGFASRGPERDDRIHAAALAEEMPVLSSERELLGAREARRPLPPQVQDELRPSFRPLAILIGQRKRGGPRGLAAGDDFEAGRFECPVAAPRGAASEMLGPDVGVQREAGRRAEYGFGRQAHAIVGDEFEGPRLAE